MRMILPFRILPQMIEVAGAGDVMNISLLLVCSLTASFLTALYATKKYGGEKSNTAVIFVGINMLAAVLLICFFGCEAITVKGIIYIILLTLSSYADIRVRECDDCCHVMIVIAALIGTELSDIPGMLLSAMITGGLIMLTVIAAKSRIGGADIKLSAASAFLLGFERGIAGLFFGTFLAVICNIAAKDKKKGFPMIPYLSAGFSAAYFIQMI